MTSNAPKAVRDVLRGAQKAHDRELDKLMAAVDTSMTNLKAAQRKLARLERLSPGEAEIVKLVKRDPLQFKVASGVILMGGCEEGAARQRRWGRDWYRAFLGADSADREWLYRKLEMYELIPMGMIYEFSKNAKTNIRASVTRPELERRVRKEIRKVIDKGNPGRLANVYGVLPLHSMIDYIYEFEGAR